jgi:hypothetical protein
VTRRRLALVAASTAVLVASLVGCGAGATPGPSFPASPVEGVIVAVDAASLSDVRGFTLRLAGGSTIAFTLGQLENPTEFPPGHLKEHQATSEPVRVYFRIESGAPIAYRIEDASAPAGSG